MEEAEKFLWEEIAQLPEHKEHLTLTCLMLLLQR